MERPGRTKVLALRVYRTVGGNAFGMAALQNDNGRRAWERPPYNPMSREERHG